MISKAIRNWGLSLAIQASEEDDLQIGCENVKSFLREP